MDLVYALTFTQRNESHRFLNKCILSLPQKLYFLFEVISIKSQFPRDKLQHYELVQQALDELLNIAIRPSNIIQQCMLIIRRHLSLPAQVPQPPNRWEAGNGTHFQYSFKRVFLTTVAGLLKQLGKYIKKLCQLVQLWHNSTYLD